MADAAVAAALEDAGLERREIDALLVHIGSPRGLDYDEMAALLGLEVSLRDPDLEPRPLRRDRDRDRGDGARARSSPTARCASPRSRTAASRASARPRTPPSSRACARAEARTPRPRTSGSPRRSAARRSRPGATCTATGSIARSSARSRSRSARAAAHNPLAADARAADARATTRRSRFVVEPLRLLDCSVPVDTAVARDPDARRPRRRAARAAGARARLPGHPRRRRTSSSSASRASASTRPPCSTTSRSARASRSTARAGVAPAEVADAALLRRLLAAGALDARALRLLRARRGGRLDRRAGGSSWAARCRSTPAAATSPRGTRTAGATRSRSSASCAGRRGARQIPGLEVAQWATTLGDSIIYGSAELTSSWIRDFPGAGDPARLLPPRNRDERAVLGRRCASGGSMLQRCGDCGARALPGRAGLPVLRRSRVRLAAAAAAAGTVHSWVRYHRGYLPEFEPLMPYVRALRRARRRARACSAACVDAGAQPRDRDGGPGDRRALRRRRVRARVPG